MNKLSKMFENKVVGFFKTLFTRWLSEDSFTQSAAASYYAVFSLPGLILVTVMIASLMYDQTTIEQEINAYTSTIIGQELSLNLQKMLQSIQLEGNSLLAICIGAGAIFFGASRFFMQLQKALNHVWKVEVKKTSKWKRVLRKRLISLALVLCVGFTLMVTLTMTSVLTLMADYIAIQIPYLNINTMVFINFGASYAIVCIMFALIYKVVPDVIVLWSSSFIGAAVSALLFMIGQGFINYYFSITDPQSAFGAAGSIILLMLWVSYAFMILLLGVHLSKIHMEYVTGKKAKAEPEIAKKVKDVQP